jgi:curved DNA-binding protein CbpA
MSSKSDELKERDWYAVLDCNLDSTKEQISKAARKLGLKYHPDKTSDPKDHELFIIVQKAKEILLDDDKRKEIDDLMKTLAARKEYEGKREKNMDTKRKRMRDELESKLKKESTKTFIPNENDILKASEKKKAANVDRLKKENRDRMHEASNESNDRNYKREKEFLQHRKNMVDDKEIKNYQIKIKWKRSRLNHSDETLFQLFKCYGDIEDVSLVGDSGHAAIISFKDEISATNAVNAYAVSTDYRVDLVLSNDMSKKKPSIFTHVYANSKSNAINKSNIRKMDFNTGDSDLMSSMKRAIEREQLLHKLQQEEDEEAGNLSMKYKTTLRPSNTESENQSSSYANSSSTSSTSNVSLKSSSILFTDNNLITFDDFVKKENEIFSRLSVLTKMAT